ncbi:MAG: hypothetical protein ACREAK_08815 [Nitrosarchaeum sp.]
MKYFFLLVPVILFLLYFQYGNALPYSTPEEIFDMADVIIKGQVISYQDTQDGQNRIYIIHVYEYLKNPQKYDTITIRSVAPNALDSHDPYDTFEAGDYVFAYLLTLRGESNYQSTNYSHKIENLTSSSIYNTEDVIKTLSENQKIKPSSNENNMDNVKYQVNDFLLLLIIPIVGIVIISGIIIKNKRKK